MYEIFMQLCKEKGVSTYQVCKDTGISQGTISNWKNRGNGISGKTLQKLAEYFGVSMEYLMGSSSIRYENETMTWISEEPEYYMDVQTKEYAQFLRDHPEYKVLFDASRKVKPEDLKKALAAIGLFIDE